MHFTEATAPSVGDFDRRVSRRKAGSHPLEKKFELFEKAIYRSQQKSDEASDSYLARCDVVWTELISKKMTLAELKAYILLRGGRLGSDAKKRVIARKRLSEKVRFRGIQAVIDTGKETMWSKLMNRHIRMTRNRKNLLLLDLDHLWPADSEHQVKSVNMTEEPTCHASESKTKFAAELNLKPSEMQQAGQGPMNQDLIQSDHSSDFQIPEKLGNVPCQTTPAEYFASSGTSRDSVLPAAQIASQNHVVGVHCLGKLRAKMEESESQDGVADLKKLSLQDLEEEVIAFGKAKLGDSLEDSAKKETKVKKNPGEAEKSWSHVKEETEEGSDRDWGAMPSKMMGVTTDMAILQDQANHMFHENQTLRHRMFNLERSMTEILAHPKNLSVQGSQ
eukprot:s225_g12.t1